MGKEDTYLSETEAESTASKGVEGIATRADARLVLDDLHPAIAAPSAENTSRCESRLRESAATPWA